MLEYIELSKDYGILEIPVPQKWIGKTLKDLDIRAKLGVNVIAVENNNKTNVSPAASYVLKDGDTLSVLGDNVALEAVQRI